MIIKDQFPTTIFYEIRLYTPSEYAVVSVRYRALYNELVTTEIPTNYTWYDPISMTLSVHFREEFDLDAFLKKLLTT